jgi:hypothetical protein
VDPAALTDPQASVNFPDLGILVAGAVDPERADRIAEAVADPENPLQAVVPERRYRALQEQPPDEEEWGGVQQGPFGEGTCRGWSCRGAPHHFRRSVLEGV